ncbi:MAG: 2-isopropylmalate synthase [Deltaproteobacteria bacterium]|nr:2-isopropylmalate synthase [Deltaproteobacteria bacterium]
MDEHEFIYDWNHLKRGGPLSGRRFEVLDETLRDGVQSPSATDPTIAEKIELLHLIEAVGIQAASLGLPGAGERAYEHALALARAIGGQRLRLKPTCAARTTTKDIVPIARIVQATGVGIEVYTFIGSSPIRLYTQDWTVDLLLHHIEEAVRFALQEGLEVCVVLEDTTRSKPQVLERIFRHAIDLGAKRLCIADTVGYSTPDGVHNIVRFVTSIIQSTGAPVRLDWHGHNDRGLAVANAIYALEYGVDRVHGTALGMGERVGNAALDQILVNLKLLDAWSADLKALGRYCEAVSKACGFPIPANYPMSGRDAFRTGTGVHAAAILKAKKKGDDYLADRIYSAVPASLFGRHQEVEISQVSGHANVVYWLEARQIPHDEALVTAILAVAKQANGVLGEAEVLGVVRRHQGV